MKRRPDSGLTLIELMLALGVGAVVMYAVTTMLTSTTKESDSLAAKNEFNELVSQVQMVLGNPTACRAAFTGQFGKPANQTKVPPLDKLTAPGLPTTVPVPIALDVGNTEKGGVAVFQAGTQLPHSKFTILNFELLGKVASNTMIDPATHQIKAVANQYEIPLHIAVSRREGGYSTSVTTDSTTGSVTSTMNARGANTATGGDLLEKIITMRVAMDDTGQFIVGCSGQNAPGWRSTGPGGSEGLICKSPKPGDPPCLDIVYKGNTTNDLYLAGNNRANVGIDADDTAPNLPGKDHFHQVVKLDINGSAMSVKYAYHSDVRYKKNIRPIPDALPRLEQLHGVVFDWKNRADGKGDQIGFLAQEVEQTFPETVKTGGDGLKSVSYPNLIAPLIEAMKERQKLLDRQDRDLAEIRRSLEKQ